MVPIFHLLLPLQDCCSVSVSRHGVSGVGLRGFTVCFFCQVVVRCKHNDERYRLLGCEAQNRDRHEDSVLDDAPEIRHQALMHLDIRVLILCCVEIPG